MGDDEMVTITVRVDEAREIKGYGRCENCGHLNVLHKEGGAFCLVDYCACVTSTSTAG